MINVVNDYFTLSMLIIQNQQIMKSWYQNKVSKKTLCIFSKNKFISNLIAVQFLQHYIENSNSDTLKFWKLMFMNNHDNYMIFEFIKLTNNNHIRSFLLIFHFTHCIQFLNVNIFQFYEHWHDVAIQKTFEKFNIEYSFFHFCHDFIKIRNNIFKNKIIRNAFRKSEMWSICWNVRFRPLATACSTYTWSHRWRGTSRLTEHRGALPLSAKAAYIDSLPPF